MKTSISIMTLITLACGVPLAEARHSFEDHARVLKVTPLYEEINRPREVCETEYVPETGSREGSLAGPLIGGIAGGVLGAQVGKGRGRVAASAAGAAIGAIVGDRLSRRRSESYYEREVTYCETIDEWETHLTGYRVIYRYRGQTRVTTMPYDPGNKLRLRVAIEPIDADAGVDDEWNR